MEDGAVLFSLSLAASGGPAGMSISCLIANLLAFMPIAGAPDAWDSHATYAGIELLRRHWEERGQRKFYLYGIGTDFRKLKYPFILYDFLPVAKVIDRFASVCSDRGFHEIFTLIGSNASEDGRLHIGSMQQAWKGRSFAKKWQPSTWLSLLVLRIPKRGGLQPCITGKKGVLSI